jgi:hypothetical protein
MSVMRRLAVSVVVLLATCAAVAAAQPSAQSVTAGQLRVKFKQAMGDKLLVNRTISYPGHYVALDVGVPTIAKKGKYGTFTIYVVNGADVEADVTDLLADGHTGVLGTPGAGKIYWESGSTLYGDKYWMAKRQYGETVVLWWIGSKPVKKTDKSFKRLHAFLTKATS